MATNLGYIISWGLLCSIDQSNPKSWGTLIDLLYKFTSKD